MATNYGAWGAGLSAAGGSGGRNAELLASALGNLRQRKQDAEEMALRQKESSRRDPSIPAREVYPDAPEGRLLTQDQYADALARKLGTKREDQMTRRYELKQQELSGDEKKRVTAAGEADAIFSSLAAKYMEHPMGAVKGTLAQAAMSIPGVGNSAIVRNALPDEANYRQNLYIAIQKRAVAITGQAMAEAEARRIAATFPPMGASPEVFNNHLETFYTEMNAALEGIPKAREISGYPDVAKGIRDRMPRYKAPRVEAPKEDNDPTGIKARLAAKRAAKQGN